jgi:hypothetical protein
MREVWTPALYESLVRTEYLKKGEEAVNEFEILIAAAAQRLYTELLSDGDPERRLSTALGESGTAVVVFDGLSLREVPIILKLAAATGLQLRDLTFTQAAIPCETIDYIERELSCGRIGPSQLPGRKELKEKGISPYYTPHPTQRITISEDNTSILIWSAFPDSTYTDSGAKFEGHFDNIHVQFETAWMNTVQQIKGKRKIVITSDHGYVFFGTAMDFLRTGTEMKDLNDYFGNNRYAYLSEKPAPPDSDDVIVDSARQVAMVKGRIRTRSTGGAATKLYRHGGLSLMEMLTPWIVFEV